MRDGETDIGERKGNEGGMEEGEVRKRERERERERERDSERERRYLVVHRKCPCDFGVLRPSHLSTSLSHRHLENYRKIRINIELIIHHS